MGFDFSLLRGFNYQPSYAGTLQLAWTGFDRAVWEREVPWALRFGSNTLRIWLDWHAYIAVGDRMLDHLDAALEVMARHGLRAMPVLFNRWNDANLPMGMVCDRDLGQADWSFAKFHPYVDALMGRFAADPRVLAWDLCNEPQAPWLPYQDINLKETAWLAAVASWVREAAAAPLTVGTMAGDNIRLFAPLVDVITFHPYASRIGEMESLCQSALAIAREQGKPLICTEACKGCFDDQDRGRQARDDVETLERHGIGWLLWQLGEGRFITGSRERTDGNALKPMQGYMPFVLADGRTRPGHEWLERKSPGGGDEAKRA